MRLPGTLQCSNHIQETAHFKYTTHFKCIKSISSINIFTLPYARKKKEIWQRGALLRVTAVLPPPTYLVIHTLDSRIISLIYLLVFLNRRKYMGFQEHFLPCNESQLSPSLLKLLIKIRHKNSLTTVYCLGFRNLYTEK